MHIRTATMEDRRKIMSLYREVSLGEGGLARMEKEVTDEYVENFLKSSIHSGLVLVAEHPKNSDVLIAEMHAYKPGPAVFKHVLSDLTIVVHPEFQGQKVGRTIFTIFLEEVALHRPDIGRVELIARESNLGAIKFYQSFGFLIEGRLEMRVKNSNGTYEADIPMGWQNPNFQF